MHACLLAIAICLLCAGIVTAKDKTVGLTVTAKSRLDEVRNSYKLHNYNVCIAIAICHAL